MFATFVSGFLLSLGFIDIALGKSLYALINISISFLLLALALYKPVKEEN